MRRLRLYPPVAQVSNLLCRRLPVGRMSESRQARGLEIRQTARWEPALRNGVVRRKSPVSGISSALRAWKGSVTATEDASDVSKPKSQRTKVSLGTCPCFLLCV